MATTPAAGRSLARSKALTAAPDVLLVGAIALSAVAAGVAGTSITGQRVAAALFALVVLGGVALRLPRSALLAMILWLPLLGLIRRLTTGAGSESPSDPFVLIGPAAVGLLFAVSVARGAFRGMTGFAWLVFSFTALAVVWSANPLIGHVDLVASGLLFIVAPMLWFWVGRELVDDRLMLRIAQILVGLAVAGALYGLFQTLVGFPSWDQRWIDTSGYAALQVGTTTRAFASFSAASEYALYLGMAVVVLAATVTPRRIWWAVPMMLILLTALVLESSRTIMFTLFVALGVVGAVRLRLPAPAAVIMGGLMLAALIALAGAVAPSSYSGDATGALLQHQLSGLADPLNPQKTTIDQHSTLVEDAFKGLPGTPLGYGTGAITAAALRYDNAHGTELDPSNAAVAMGFPGLIACILVIAAGLAAAYRLARRRRDAVAVAAMGIVVVSTGQWLTGNQYAAVMLVWLTLGWVDGRWRELRASAGSAPALA